MLSTGKMNRPAIGLRAAAALSAMTALALSGCTTLHTAAPSAVRAHAAAVSALSAGFGTVDCREAKCIALTFDSAPSEYSERLLDILAEKKVPATFFVLGTHIAKYPELVARMAAEGHEVANHTWDHKILTGLSPQQIHDELEKTDEALEKLTGHKPTLMRSPQGRTNDAVHRVCRELGLAEVLWSVTAKDYTTNDSELIEKRVLKQATRDGIVLLHDLYPGTVPAVPGIIDALRERGYVFVTVPQLLAPGKAEPGKVYRP